MARRRTPRLALGLLVEAGDWPKKAELRRLVSAAVKAALVETGADPDGPSELSVVFTDDAHIRALNGNWRAKDKPTNVLSFPAFPTRPGARLPPILGDIVLASETISREAAEENKAWEHHATHLVIHGLLHLLGHDHETDEDAELMEGIERRALARLAMADPYA